MNRWWILFLASCISAERPYAQGAPPIGSWREHLPFNNALRVKSAGDFIWCATPYGLFSYEKSDASFKRVTKVNGLSEVRVRQMELEPTGDGILVVYDNSNVDILKGDRIKNIPDIWLSNVSGDRTVYSALWRGNEIFLNTGLGIIVLDPLKYQVKDTYRPSFSGNDLRVNQLAWLNGSYYAATVEGLKKAASSGQNLSDYRNWQPVSGLTPGSCDGVSVLGTSLIARKNDSLFMQQVNGSWRSILSDGIPITSVDVSGNRLFVGQSVAGKGRVTILDAVGAFVGRLEANEISVPRQTMAEGAVYWVADQNNGLLRVENNRATRVFPNSPINTSSGDMLFTGGQLWAAAGAVNEAWNYTYNPNGIYQLKDDAWFGINLYVQPRLDSMLDFVSLAADPSAGVVFAGSYGGGLLEIGKDNSLRIYKQQTGLQEAIGDKGSYRVAGLVMDQKGTLWIANYGAPQDLVARKKDGSWKRFTIPFLHTENAVSQILLDEYDRKWIVSPKGNGVFCLDDGGTIDNITDDRWRYFRQGRGNGNLPTSEVQCLARDRDGFIWVGTAKGIAVIECMDDVFSGKCEAVLPVVQQDNFAGLLFSDEEVRTIAVDGANRKWVGTRNGVWLLSSDGTKVIHRFTEANSPLLSNIIHRIAIDPATGEVFISTFNGICSFRGTATESEENEGKVLVFPNPVPPGYTGTIAIRGLVRDAFVKITEPDGRLVHQTRALGGQAIWDGRNYKGEKVSSGVYLVFIMDENGLNSQAAKIFFVR